MTEQQQREACAELAQRMGWRLEPEVDNWFRQTGRQIWRHPVTLIERQLPPDYFTDPAASRELAAWLAADDARWFVFIRQLIKLIDWPTQSAHKIADATFAEIASEVRYLMTAPLPVIAKAACKALGIEVSE